MVLAIDPSRSPHFKVICARQFSCELSQIVIYSAKTKSWKVCGQLFHEDGCNGFRSRVYLNGMIHWTCSGGSDSTCYYFKIDHERLETMPMPPRPTTSFGSQTCCGPSYFGASHGHLHHIETYGPCCTVFDVYEMQKDYSGWFLKYRVDLVESPNFWTYADPVRQKYRLRIQMLSIVRGQREEDSFLMLEIPSKILEYNLVEMTFKQLNEFTPGHEYRDWDSVAFGLTVLDNRCSESTMKGMKHNQEVPPVLRLILDLINITPLQNYYVFKAARVHKNVLMFVESRK